MKTLRTARIQLGMKIEDLVMFHMICYWLLLLTNFYKLINFCWITMYCYFMLACCFLHGFCRIIINLCYYEEKIQERMKLKWTMQTCVIDLEWHSFKFNTSLRFSSQLHPPFILQVCLNFPRTFSYQVLPIYVN